MAFGFPASYSTEVDLDVYRRAARDATQETLRSLGWPFENPHPDIYFATIPFSGSSWGEKLTIRFSERGLLEIESKCSPVPQLFDWGKNKKNVDKFVEMVTAKAGRISKMDSLTWPRFDTSTSTPLERVLADKNRDWAANRIIPPETAALDRS